MHLLEPDAALDRALSTAGVGPVVIADTQDNPGAGGTARTTGLLRTLLAHDTPEPMAIGLFSDGAAAAAAHAAGIGATVSLSIGGDPRYPATRRSPPRSPSSTWPTDGAASTDPCCTAPTSISGRRPACDTGPSGSR